MADMKGLSTLRPFICVGFAYFLIAVVFPLIVLLTKGETGKWSTAGTIWSFYAGSIGALGALGIILAFKFKGAPVYVMPLVFGCAPVVNTFVTMYMSRTFGDASKLFIASIIVVAHWCWWSHGIQAKASPRKKNQHRSDLKSVSKK